MGSENILVWNVRGLNSPARRDTVRELIAAERPSLICLQETKLFVINDFDVLCIAGAGFDYVFLPAANTRGGILVAWRSDTWAVTNVSMHTYSVSAKVQALADGNEFWLTTVYGLATDPDKPAFLQELHDLRQVRLGAWLLTGDFNMIYRAQDKNNNILNRQRIGQFRRFINDASLKELHLKGRLFTWSNERVHPTLERIDRAFVTTDWELLYPNSDLYSLASSCSDHAPLLLCTDCNFSYKKRFHFRSFWPKLPGFLEVVQQAWHCPLNGADPFQRLDWLLRNTARMLQSWNARSIGNVRLQLEIAKEVLHRLEIAQDHRTLAAHEDELRRNLKWKSLALSSLQRTIALQESRIHWLAEGDAPTKFFHVYANVRRRKKFIRSLHQDGQEVRDEEGKAEIALRYFEDVLGTPATRTNSTTLGP